MKRLAVLGCTLLVVAACGGGGSSVNFVPTLINIGSEAPRVVDGSSSSYTSTHFAEWGLMGHSVRVEAGEDLELALSRCEASGCGSLGDGGLPGEETYFRVFLDSALDGTVTTTVEGVPSGTSPTIGSAVWTGGVLAYDAEDVIFEGSTVTTYMPVSGDARLEVDFAAVTIDVDFTNFDNSQADMSWSALAIDNGTFGDASVGIDGSFYGADHEGAAGTFERDDLTGVFGALRSSE